MGRFPIAIVFFLVSMMAILATHAADHTLDGPGGSEYVAGSTLVRSNAGRWLYGVDSPDLESIKEVADGPAAAAEPEGGFAFVRRKICDHAIKCYKKVPIVGF